MNYDLENQSIQSVNFPLPGGNNQIKHLFEQNIQSGKHALVIGPINNSIITKLIGYFIEIHVIADSYDALMDIRAKLKPSDSVKIKMMDFKHTDFGENRFDLIYSQGTISVHERKNILKEIKRIASDDCLFCIGEIVSLKAPVPAFIKDIWERSGLDPLPSATLTQFYEGKGFRIASEKDLSNTLINFYESVRDVVVEAKKDKKEMDKKYFSQMKHESNAFLKLGGDKYIGYKTLVMRKSN